MQKIILLAVTIISCTLHAQVKIYHKDSLPIKVVKKSIEIPKLKKADTLIEHIAYSLTYNEKHEQANWIAYQLTSTEANNVFERSDKFIEDPFIKTGTASNKDYSKSGYDRGHLAPAADMGWSEQSMIESFYFSNMSPQAPSFNRGIWKELEALVRDWAILYDSIYIVTGPILTDSLKQIGPNQVSIPLKYYKAILDNSADRKQAIAFILPNEGSDKNLTEFVISIDELEKISGIDFFDSIPNKTEKLIEKKSCIECWEWNLKK